MSEGKRPLGRPKKPEFEGDKLQVIDDFVSELDGMEKLDNMYKYIPSEINTDHNIEVVDEYLLIFKKTFPEYLSFSLIKKRKNKPQSLLRIVTRLCKFTEAHITENKKQYKILVFPSS